MTNKEKYKQAFSVLHTSDHFTMEIAEMALSRKKKKRNRCSGCSSRMYLTGRRHRNGLCRKCRRHSKNHSAPDENGNAVERGGGIAIEADGSERSLTQEELIEELYAPEVSYEEDGSVWVYYYDQRLDITDKFDDDGVCYVKLRKADETLYLTVKYQNGYSYSSKKYVSPVEFN